MKCLALNKIPVVLAILVVICLICVFHVKLESIYIFVKIWLIQLVLFQYRLFLLLCCRFYSF